MDSVGLQPISRPATYLDAPNRGVDKRKIRV